MGGGFEGSRQALALECCRSSPCKNCVRCHAAPRRRAQPVPLPPCCHLPPAKRRLLELPAALSAAGRPRRRHPAGSMKPALPSRRRQGVQRAAGGCHTSLPWEPGCPLGPQTADLCRSDKAALTGGSPCCLVCCMAVMPGSGLGPWQLQPLPDAWTSEQTQRASQPTPHLALSGAIGPLDRDERPSSHGYTRRPLRKLLPKDRSRRASLPCPPPAAGPARVQTPMAVRPNAVSFPTSLYFEVVCTHITAYQRNSGFCSARSKLLGFQQLSQTARMMAAQFQLLFYSVPFFFQALCTYEHQVQGRGRALLPRLPPPLPAATAACGPMRPTCYMQPGYGLYCWVEEKYPGKQ